MPSMLMIGKALKEEFPFDDKYRFYIGSDEENGDYVSFNRGMEALSDAIVLWDLISPQVRQEFEGFVRNEIEVEWNEFETGGYRVTVEQTKRLLEMIDDIDLKVDRFVDAPGKVLPEHYDFVSKRIGLHTGNDRIGRMMTNVYWLKAFMRKAVELNYELAFG